jgi:hypothetical protein
MLADRMRMVSGIKKLVTKALLHFNEPNGTTTFTDETGRVWTGSGNAATTTSGKFGNAAWFDGIASVIKTPMTPDLALGTKDFTIECFAQRSVTGEIHTLIAQYDSEIVANRAFYIQFSTTNKLFAIVYVGGTGYTISSPSTIATGWRHVALVRNGDTIILFVDGVNLASVVVGTGAVTDTSIDVSIGAFSEGQYAMYGRIDEVRITIGEALYTSNFTTPTNEFSL